MVSSQDYRKVKQAKQGKEYCCSINNQPSLMQKIINAALAAAMPNTNIEVILEIINQTPNVIIATEKLLGIYEAPELLPFSTNGVKDKPVERKFISVNFWTDEVKFSYMDEKTVLRYFPTGTTRRQAENGEVQGYANKMDIPGYSPTSGSEYWHIGTGEFEPRTGTCSIATWQENHFRKPPRHEEDIYGVDEPATVTV